MSGPRNRVQAGNMPSGRRTSAPARSGALEPEKQTAACSAGAGQRPSPQPAPRSPRAQRRPLLPSPLSGRSPRPAPATRCPCTPSRTRRSPSAAQGEGITGERPRERGREGGRRRGASAPSRIKGGDGSGGGRLRLRHSPRDGTRPRRTPARRCRRPLGKSPAGEGDALAREPPASISPRRFCSIPGILSAPSDLHTVAAQTLR